MASELTCDVDDGAWALLELAIDGALDEGRRVAGFCAIWQEPRVRTPNTNPPIRTWSFVTRIFFYKIRTCPSGIVRRILSKIVLTGGAGVNDENAR